MRSIHLATLLTSVVSISALACGGAIDSHDTSKSAPAGAASGATSSGAPTGDQAPTSTAFTPVDKMSPIEAFGRISAKGFDGAVARHAYVDDETPKPGPDCSGFDAKRLNLGEATIGDPCAADRTKCLATLDCLYSADGFEGGNSIVSPMHYYFIFGDKGALTLVSTRADLLAKLGTIDSAEKAVFIAALEATPYGFVLGYRAAATGGWDLKMHGGGGCAAMDTYEATIHIALDGTVTLPNATLSLHDGSRCSDG